MFVKIIQREKITEKKTNITIKTYDCIKYMIYPGDSENTISLIVEIAGEQDGRAMQFKKEEIEIIAMNNNGKTIDRITF